MTIVEKLVYALNNMKNTSGVGPNGESSYELLAEYDRISKDQLGLKDDHTIVEEYRLFKNWLNERGYHKVSESQETSRI